MRRSIMYIGLFSAASLSVAGYAAAQVPAGYPSNYAEIVAAGQDEGSLLIYTNMSQHNWQNVIDGFNTLYPEITVEILDVGSRESIERYLAESATGVGTADLIATASQPGWIDMNDRDQILDYESPEAAAWPDWSKPFDGLYTISTDPLVFAWSALQVPEEKRARTFADFVANLEEDPGFWANKVTSYSPIVSPFGYVAHWYFIQHHGEDLGWHYLETIGSLPPRLEGTGGPQIEKVTSGEYAVSYFMSGITVWPRVDTAGRGQFLDWNYIEDGQPLMMRGVGIPRGSAHQNAAKLMLDYILSEGGQEAFGEGGLTPARPGVQTSETIRATYSSIVEQVGEENVIMLGYDPRMMSEYDAYQERLRQALGQ